MSRYHPESNKRTGRCWVQALCCLSLCCSYLSLDSSPLSPPESMGHWMTRSRPLPAGSCLGKEPRECLAAVISSSALATGAKVLAHLGESTSPRRDGKIPTGKKQKENHGPRLSGICHPDHLTRVVQWTRPGPGPRKKLSRSGEEGKRDQMNLWFPSSVRT